MKALDIINQLAIRLPTLTGKFTSDFTITSLTRSGTTVTAVTSAAHGLSVGEQANIVGAKTSLTISSLTRSSVIGTLVTDNDHDITEGSQLTIDLSGSVEAEFNGTFIILTVPNRKTITFTMTDAGPTTATGTPLLLNGASALQQYNGLHNIATVPTTTSFTYEITDTTLYTPATGTIIARTNPRVSGGIDEESIIAAYTKRGSSDLWAFVVLNDRAASKSRNIDSDATANLQPNEEFRQQVIMPFSVFVFFPATTYIAARQARDEAEDIFRFLAKSLLGLKIDNNLHTGAQNPIVFNAHGYAIYTGGYYLHRYDFEAVGDLTFDDTIGYDLDVAFRDIAMTQNVNIGTESPLTANIDLDDVILP